MCSKRLHFYSISGAADGSIPAGNCFSLPEPHFIEKIALDSLTHLNRYFEKEKKRAVKGAFHSEDTDKKDEPAIEMVKVVGLKPAATGDQR